MSLADDLFRAAFEVSREPRSDEYKAGIKAVLAFLADRAPLARPYAVGTVQADAFYAGTDEGHRIWRRYQEAQS